MAPRRGILPRSVRDRYHRARAEPEEPIATEDALGAEAERNGAVAEVPQPVPDPEPIPPPEPIPDPEPIPEPDPDTDGPPPAARRHIGRRVVAITGLTAAALACAVVGIVLGSVASSTGDSDPTTTAATSKPAAATTTAGTSKPTAATSVPAGAEPAGAASSTTPPGAASTPGAHIPLRLGGDYDPLGDGSEHPAALPLAIDHDRSTAWSTEAYQVLNKAGVGFYVDPKGSTAPARALIETSTPGFAVALYGSHRRRAPGAVAQRTKLGREGNVKAGRPIALSAGGRSFRHVLVWITALPPGGGAVKVSELKLTS